MRMRGAFWLSWVAAKHGFGAWRSRATQKSGAGPPPHPLHPTLQLMRDSHRRQCHRNTPHAAVAALKGYVQPGRQGPGQWSRPRSRWTQGWFLEWPPQQPGRWTRPARSRQVQSLSGSSSLSRALAWLGMRASACAGTDYSCLLTDSNKPPADGAPPPPAAADSGAPGGAPAPRGERPPWSACFTSFSAGADAPASAGWSCRGLRDASHRSCSRSQPRRSAAP
jgi:hypothetical protein